MLFSLILIVVGISIIAVIISNNKKRKQLWSAYQKALASGDKRAALIAGRTYYAKRRGGKLSVYDEQAISNDIAVM